MLTNPCDLSPFHTNYLREPCYFWEQAVAEASCAVWEQIVSILEAALFAHVDQPACDSFSPSLTKAFPSLPFPYIGWLHPFLRHLFASRGCVPRLLARVGVPRRAPTPVSWSEAKVELRFLHKSWMRRGGVMR
jgi:hypothetical protein